MKSYKKPKFTANLLEGLLFTAYNLGRACDVKAFSIEVDAKLPENLFIPPGLPQAPVNPSFEIDILVSDIVIESSHWIFLALIVLESMRAYAFFSSNNKTLGNKSFHAARWAFTVTGCILACLAAELQDSESFDPQLAGLCANILFICAWGGTALRYLGLGIRDAAPSIESEQQDGKKPEKKVIPHFAIGTIMSLVTLGAGLRYFGDGSESTLELALLILLATPIVQLGFALYQTPKEKSPYAHYLQLACTLTYIAAYCWFAISEISNEPIEPDPSDEFSLLSPAENAVDSATQIAQISLMGAPVLLSTGISLNQVLRSHPSHSS